MNASNKAKTALKILCFVGGYFLLGAFLIEFTSNFTLITFKNAVLAIASLVAYFVIPLILYWRLRKRVGLVKSTVLGFATPALLLIAFTFTVPVLVTESGYEGWNSGEKCECTGIEFLESPVNVFSSQVTMLDAGTRYYCFGSVHNCEKYDYNTGPSICDKICDAFQQVCTDDKPHNQLPGCNDSERTDNCVCNHAKK